MAFAFSAWSTMDNWLWGDRCQATECGLKNFYMTNIKITTGNNKPGPDPPKPVDCEDCQFGNECSSKSDDFCDGSCDCRWSWPASESASGKDAACRCKKDPKPDACVECQYGNECDSKDADDCNGSCDCRWSWPAAESWDGPDAKCRCKL